MEQFKITPEILSSLSHELRSPLTSVKGYISAALDSETLEEKDKMLSVAESKADEVLSMIQDLISLSKLFCDTYSADFTVFDINELIRIAVIEKIPAIEKKQIEVKAELDGERLLVSADRALIYHTLLNLIDNAVKYGKNGGYIRIATRRNKEKAEIAVEDNGCGIKGEDIPFIFDSMFQSDAGKRTFGGHGLGLSFVKRALFLHNEEVSVKSECDIGTSFSFSLKASI